MKTEVHPRKAVHAEFLYFWGWTLIVLLAIVAIATPFECAFLMEEESVEGYILAYHYVVMIVFTADMILNFITAYPDPISENYITDRRRIAFNYMSSWWFLTDFLATVPIHLLIPHRSATGSITVGRGLRLVRLFRLLRLLKVLQIMGKDEMRNRLHLRMAIPFLHRFILKFIVLLLYSAHWIACAFGLLGWFAKFVTESARAHSY